MKKKLSVEEKAHLYDKAIERAKDLISRCKNDRDRRTMIYRLEDIESLFPELAESEDERIRKDIIHLVQKSHEQGGYALHKYEASEMLAWLEKQGQTFTKKDVDDAYIKGVFDAKKEFEKQDSQLLDNSAKTCKDEKETTWSEEDEKIRTVLVELISTYLRGNENGKIHGVYAKDILAYLEKQGEQKFAEIDNKFLKMRETKPANIVEFLDRLTTVEQEFLWEHIEKVKKIDMKEREQKPYGQRQECADCQFNYAGECKGSCAMKRGEQKPAEDVDLPEFESHLCLMFQKFRTKGICTNGEIIDYVKEHSQKLRDILVKPIAWNEEDEEILDKVITNYESGYLPSVEKRDEIIKKLKSLRPQNTWKPSDIQMRILSIYTDQNNTHSSVLASLYNDLKKLRKE